jgi:hypothetical protein
MVVPFPDTAALLGALIKRFSSDKTVVLTKEEIEDAPDIEMRELFETDQVELRLSTYGNQ